MLTSLHTYGLSPVCILLCFFIAPLDGNLLGHKSQGYGFSPVWVLTWILSRAEPWNSFWQYSQIKSFFLFPWPAWALKWSAKLSLRWNTLLQTYISQKINKTGNTKLELISTLQTNASLGAPLHPVWAICLSKWYLRVNSRPQSGHFMHLDNGWTFIWSISCSFCLNSFLQSTHLKISPSQCSILRWRSRLFCWTKSLSHFSHLKSPIW